MNSQELKEKAAGVAAALQSGEAGANLKAKEFLIHVVANADAKLLEMLVLGIVAAAEMNLDWVSQN